MSSITTAVGGAWFGVDPLAQAFRPGLVSPKHLRSQEIELQCLGEPLLRAARTEQKAAAGRWRLLLTDSPGFCTGCTASIWFTPASGVTRFCTGLVPCF